MSQFQGSVNSSAMFLTAAAQNLLCMKVRACETARTKI